MIGTDYSRTDICANLSALHEIRGWADEGQDQQRPSPRDSGEQLPGILRPVARHDVQSVQAVC